MGRHPHETEGFGAARSSRRSSARRPTRAHAIGETGLDYYRDHAPRDDQRRAFEAQLHLAARLGLPVAIHTRAAEADTFAALREHAGEIPAVILHCFSAPDRLAECVEHGYLCSFAGNVTYPKATELQTAARALPAELLLVETDAPFLAPQPVRGKANEPANVTHTARSWPSCVAWDTGSSSRPSSTTPGGSFGGEPEPARPACAACAGTTFTPIASSARTS